MFNGNDEEKNKKRKSDQVNTRKRFSVRHQIQLKNLSEANLISLSESIY